MLCRKRLHPVLYEAAADPFLFTVFGVPGQLHALGHDQKYDFAFLFRGPETSVESPMAKVQKLARLELTVSSHLCFGNYRLKTAHSIRCQGFSKYQY